MIDIADIVKRNNETFYDYRLNKSESIIKRVLLQAFFSVVFAMLFNKGVTTFLEALISVQAILMGFAFSVMFYLMSSNEGSIKYKIDDDVSLEARNRAKRKKAISEEVFYNISYFNLICLVSISLSLYMLLAASGGAYSNLLHVVSNINNKVVQLVITLNSILWFILLSILYFIVVEIGYTFLRITARMNFLFDPVNKINKSI